MCDPDYVEELEERKCIHCGTPEEETEHGLVIIPCSLGFNLLHCRECIQICGVCELPFCSKDIKMIDCGETWGKVGTCEGCRKDLGIE